MYWEWLGLIWKLKCKHDIHVALLSLVAVLVKTSEWHGDQLFRHALFTELMGYVNHDWAWYNLRDLFGVTTSDPRTAMLQELTFVGRRNLISKNP